MQKLYLRSEFYNYTMLKKIWVSEMLRYITEDAPNTGRYLTEASQHPRSTACMSSQP